MTIKSFAAAAALACATVAAPAFAQDAGATTGATVGATIYGPDGQAVGTIEQVQGTNVVVNTGNMTATIPANVLGEGDNGPTMGWNKADFEAAISAAEQESQAALASKFVSGTQLYSTDNQVVGTVTEIGPEGMIVVEHVTAGPIRLPRDQFALQGENLTFLATAADLSAAVSAQAGAAPAATAETAVADDAAATAGAETPATGM